MKEQLIQEIQRKMLPYLNNEQLLQLGDALTEALQGVSVSYEDATPKKEERMPLKRSLLPSALKVAPRRP